MRFAQDSYQGMPSGIRKHQIVTAASGGALRKLNMPDNHNSSSPSIGLFCLCVLLAFSFACTRGAPPPAAHTEAGTKRYSLKGKVISVNKQAGNASIYNDPIAGFMDPMAMPYTIKPPATLNELLPGDSITADVVVEPDKYWLENVKVTSHSLAPAGKPTPAAEKQEK